jgi:hypothetical protein
VRVVCARCVCLVLVIWWWFLRWGRGGSHTLSLRTHRIDTRKMANRDAPPMCPAGAPQYAGTQPPRIAGSLRIRRGAPNTRSSSWCRILLRPGSRTFARSSRASSDRHMSAERWSSRSRKIWSRTFLGEPQMLLGSRTSPLPQLKY